MKRYIWIVQILDDSGEVIEQLKDHDFNNIYRHVIETYPQYYNGKSNGFRKIASRRKTKHFIFQTEDMPKQTNAESQRKYRQKFIDRITELEEKIAQLPTA